MFEVQEMKPLSKPIGVSYDGTWEFMQLRNGKSIIIIAEMSKKVEGI